MAQNEKEKALDLAKKAVEADTNSAPARIALSYAEQANFNLEEALNNLKEAVKLEPENALAWARLAELQLSFGRLNEALEAAQKAVAIEPNLSRTQTVLGFAYLTKVKTKDSKEAFEKAIALDQADPLPRLGLGLAKIRESDLREGRRDLEVALSLDPNNALVRSYLGKAYFEEKKDNLAADQFNTAKDFDPLDPTPFFYDAIHKQTTNRPVEALHDLQKAIELNDNRAVYRSKLLLDSDLAARSASLGRIYSDLGFQQLALIEGWKSVNADPSDFSGHRFLSDSYSVLPRHEIARVSELLQSQLLQPINITPIQPRLEESDLFLISAGGPAAVSFNEFNPLFYRNRIALQTSGIVGENGTWGGEGVVSGIYKKFSFSAGYTHFETDGWRKNADQDDDIANIFLQFELSPKTSIQAEYRYRDLERGDPQLRFFPEDVFFGQTNTEEWDTYRLGVRHSFSPSSVILGSLIYTDAEFGVRDEEPVVAPGVVTLLDIKNPQDAVSGEVQHLYRSRYVNLTSGAGYVDSDGIIDITTVLNPIIVPLPDNKTQVRVDGDVKHANVYAYSNIKPLDNLTFTVGASGDFTDADSPDIGNKSQFNPKLGIVWSPFPDTTVRAAAFRVLKRILITDQTLEPTQVAGFNQFFDDFNGTEAWRYGGAIDQKFARDISGGVELSKRDLETPWLDQFGNSSEVDWEESLIRAYLFWTPHAWLALKAEYQYERVEREEELTDGVKEMDTHRVPLGINFFHPCGLSASVTTTYYNQDGEFERIIGGGGVFQTGKDDFWLVDAAINYRLPKRYGFITIGARNLFDEEFKYYDLDWENPSIQPERFFFARLTLALP
ncbi:MAG: TonB-dependent receptor [Nitrospirota bacterium]